MTKSAKWTAFALASLLFLTTACSGGGGNNNNGASPSAPSSEAPPASSGSASPSASPVEAIDPFGKYPETVEFTTVRPVANNPQFPEGQSYEENDFNKFMQDQLNVKPKIVWTSPQDGGAYNKKLQLAINGNDIPDVFQIVDTSPTAVLSTLKRLVDADMIEDLTEVYEQYASPQMKEAFGSADNAVLDLFKVDGKLYALPGQNSLENFNFVWVREDWRKKLGLPEPKTLDDVIALAQAFKDKDPYGDGKTVPIAMQMEKEAAGLFGPGFLFDQFGAYPDLFYKNDAGEVAFGGIQPGIKDGLKVLSQLYKGGLVEKDIALKDTGKLQELLASGRAGIVGQAWWGVWYPLFMTLQNVPDADWKPYIIPSKLNGKINYGTTLPVNGILVVKKGFKNPELPIKWLNVYNDPQHDEFFMKLGQDKFKDANDKEPILWGMGVNSTDKITKEAKQIVGAVNGTVDPSTLPVTNKDAYNHIKKYIDELQDQPQAASKNMLQWQNTRSWYDAMGSAAQYELNVVYSAFDGQTPTMEKKLTALKDLQMKAYHSMIMKSTDIDADFDKFASDWKSQGGDEILAEIAEALKK
ncbi:extracellular solute-binding protein [Cohnella herbarum]|uniref:Extracellular solute-binding protein n=1 Tax=Cohnella herbarum TaxID=2728023 RepID=A0A7Z2VNV7_9BACL|nr:extracellular solute-binding protein [Cohnella herbarum]QJD86778.1 extracellular solute-binding protein [Cohnella herbarum]